MPVCQGFQSRRRGDGGGGGPSKAGGGGGIGLKRGGGMKLGGIKGRSGPSRGMRASTLKENWRKNCLVSIFQWVQNLVSLLSTALLGT